MDLDLHDHLDHDAPTETALPDGVRAVDIADQMATAYLNYAMSVIVSRAVPDVRDGLKPVHRRILYAMDERGYNASKPHRKSAQSVGYVMGTYHPHGDAAIYDSMVRMAQPWAQRHPLIDGQGNFGSRDGDKPAAMRYTEARLHRLAQSMTSDIDKDTVDWQPSYDGSTKEPKVLPARFPNLLVNGQQGIAVTMATSIPTHNLGETIDACLLVLERPDASLDDVLKVMPGPDFPTGGTIMGIGGIRQAYLTGRGSIRITGSAEIEEGKGGKHRIVITDLPYGASAKAFQERVAELIERKVVEGVTDIRDESDRKHNLRVVVDLRRDVEPNVILNVLKKHTDLVSSFPYNATVLNSRGRPTEMPLLDILSEFVAFRRQVVRRRTIHDLNKARDSLHRQIGLYAAVSLVDEVVRTIRTSPDPESARARLMDMEFPTEGDFARLLAEADPDGEVGQVFRLSEIQARAILEMRLQKLTGMERDEIEASAREISGEINGHIAILNDKAILDSVVRNELEEVKAKFATPRLTVIEQQDWDDIDDEDLIERKDVVVTITKSGYVKRTELSAYREQKRGGKGRNGMETKDDDFVSTTLVCTTKTPLVFMTSRGIAHSLKAYRLPEGAPAAKGRPLVNFVPLREGETISAVIAMPEDPAELEGKSLVFVTDFGTVRRNAAKAFWGINKAGKIAIKLEDDLGNPTGRLVSVLLGSDEDDVLVATRQGQCVRFPIDDVREVKSRSGIGVKAINLGNGNEVIGASVLRHFKATPQERDAYQAGGTTVSRSEDGTEVHVTLAAERIAEMRASEEFLLTISGLGFGKRSSAYEYRTTNRGAKGIQAANINSITGPLVACFTVTDDDGLVLVTDGGQAIRVRAKDVRTTGRTARGVRMFKLPQGQKIVSVARISADDIGDGEAATPEADSPEA